MACRNIIHGARGLAVGVWTPHTLTAKVGPVQTSGLGPSGDDARSSYTRWSPVQGIKIDLGKFELPSKPPIELQPLPSGLKYAFLNGN